MAVASVAILMVVSWGVARRTHNLGWVDFGWVACVVASSLVHSLAGPGWWLRRALIALMVGLWGGRLLRHLGSRLGGPQDERYDELARKPAGWLFCFFQAEGLLALVLTWPLARVAAVERPFLEAWEWAGLGLFLLAFAGETIADRQLHDFKERSEGVCRTGLWKYSRHPNYFFEWLTWVAWAVLAGFARAWLSPAIMLYLLTCVTGIPPAERQALKRRGEEYRHYQRTTSAFVPWLPGEA